MKYIIISALLFLSACSYTGGVENPLIRKFNWFSFMNAEDIRKVCGDLGEDRYRIIYNGIYQEQVRIYDVFFHSKILKGRIIGPANLSEISKGNLAEPWIGETFELQLNGKEIDILKKLARNNVATQQISKRTILSSNSFYWTFAYCLDGEFVFNAREETIGDWENFELGQFLLSLDVTDIKFNEPRFLHRSEIFSLEERYNSFNVQVGNNGLVGFEGG